MSRRAEIVVVGALTDVPDAPAIFVLFVHAEKFIEIKARLAMKNRINILTSLA
jgi:hypothetical protein